MQSIANKENDLDQMLDQLDKAERGIREKETLTRQAKEDARVLGTDIEVRETELKRVKEALDSNELMMTAVTQRLVKIELIINQFNQLHFLIILKGFTE